MNCSLYPLSIPQFHTSSFFLVVALLACALIHFDESLSVKLQRECVCGNGHIHILVIFLWWLNGVEFLCASILSLSLKTLIYLSFFLSFFLSLIVLRLYMHSIFCNQLLLSINAKHSMYYEPYIHSHSSMVNTLEVW